MSFSLDISFSLFPFDFRLDMSEFSDFPLSVRHNDYDYTCFVFKGTFPVLLILHVFDF